MTYLNQITFKKFITLQRGFDLPKNRRVDGKYPVVASTSIQGYHAEYKVKPPGVATGRSGSLGQVIFIDQPFWPLNTTLWVKDFKNNVPKYVYYFLQTLGLEKYNSGAGVPTLNRNHLDSLIIEIHDVSDQRKIAAILSAYDDLIENNTRRIKILEEMAQALYREWFVNFRFPGHEKVRMEESELGPKPEGWEVKTLGEVVEFRNGKAAKATESGTYPLYGSNGLIGKTNKSQYKNGIIIGRVGAYCGSTIYCRSDFWASDNTIVALPVDDRYLCVELIYYILKNMGLRSYAGGAAQPLLTQTVLKRLSVIAPGSETNGEFKNMAKSINDDLINLNERNLILRRTRDLLLPKLISGEIDLDAIEVDMDRFKS